MQHCDVVVHDVISNWLGGTAPLMGQPQRHASSCDVHAERGEANAPGRLKQITGNLQKIFTGTTFIFDCIQE